MKFINKTKLSLISALFIANVAAGTIVSATSYEITASSVASDTITLDWQAQEGADGYKVYKFDSEAEGYVIYKTSASDSCTIKDLEPDTTYKFKIVSFKKNSNGRQAIISSSGAVNVSTTPVSVAESKKPVQNKSKQENPVQSVSVPDRSNQSLKIESMKNELKETKATLADVRKDMSSCRKRLEANKKFVQDCSEHSKDNIELQKELSIARQAIEEDTDLLHRLQMEEHSLTATKNSLTTQLRSMGVGYKELI